MKKSFYTLLIILILFIIALPVKKWIAFGTKAGKMDITLYGKVIDQNGSPVSGVKVDYYIVGAYLAKGSGSGFAITDNQGIFKATGSGSKIFVKNFIAPEIEYKSLTPSLSNIGEKYNRNGILDWDKYTVDTPKTYKVWRNETYENVARGNVSGHINSDGSAYSINFLHPDGWRKAVTKGINDDSILNITCKRDQMETGQDYQNWEYTLSPVGGGIQSTDDQYLNSAPNEGYTPTIIIQRDNQPKNISLYNQKYYFKYTKNSKERFGSLIVHYEPHSHTRDMNFRILNLCKIRIEYRINLEGSNNLAVQPVQY